MNKYREEVNVRRRVTQKTYTFQAAPQLGHDPQTLDSIHAQLAPWRLFGKGKLIKRNTVVRHI
jgi:hypothetical protein